MLKAGEYIIKEFFAGDHELARNPRNAVKIESLNQLIKRLQEDDGKAPSKHGSMTPLSLLLTNTISRKSISVRTENSAIARRSI
jgi:hypothetical protein